MQIRKCFKKMVCRDQFEHRISQKFQSFVAPFIILLIEIGPVHKSLIEYGFIFELNTYFFFKFRKIFHFLFFLKAALLFIILLKTPLTNFALLYPPNSLATSIASFTATKSGISSSNKISNTPIRRIVRSIKAIFARGQSG